MNTRKILKATVEEQHLIEQLTADPAFERLDRGDVEIVDPDDWSGVPEIGHTRSVRVPADLYDRLRAASRKRRTTPDRLASRMLAKELKLS